MRRGRAYCGGLAGVWTYAIVDPSGDQAGRISDPGSVVNWVMFNDWTSTIQTSELRLASGSFVRFETKAMRRPSGRPGNVVFVERSRGQDFGLAAAQPRRRQRVAQIDQIYMLFAIVEPLGSPLVTEPGDDNYGRSVGGTELRFGLGITRDDRQPAAVRSPTVARYSSSKGGHRKGRAAAQRKQEDLSPARCASGDAPRIRIPVGHKSKIPAVGGESGQAVVILAP